eukprot:140524_1
MQLRLAEISELWAWIDKYYKTEDTKRNRKFKQKQKKKYRVHTEFMNKTKSMKDIHIYYKSLCQWIEMRDNIIDPPPALVAYKKKLIRFSCDDTKSYASTHIQTNSVSDVRFHPYRNPSPIQSLSLGLPLPFSRHSVASNNVDPTITDEIIIKKEIKYEPKCTLHPLENVNNSARKDIQYDDENNDDIDIVNLKHRSRTRKSIDDALAITVPHKFRISELPLYGSQLKYLIFTNDKQYQRRGNYYIICNSNNSNTNPPQPAHQQQPQTHNMPQPENEHQPQYASAASSPHNTNNQPFKPTIRTKESQLDQCNQSQLSEYEGVDPTASAVQPPNCDVCITDEIIIKKEIKFEPKYTFPALEHDNNSQIDDIEYDDDENNEDIDIVNDNVDDGVIKIMEDHYNVKFCPKCGDKCLRTDQDIKDKCGVMTCTKCGDNSDKHYTYWCWDCSSIIPIESMLDTTEPTATCKHCRLISRDKRTKCKKPVYK